MGQLPQQIDMSRIGYAVRPSWSKEPVKQMIEKFGKEESVRRWSFQLEVPEDEAEKWIDAYLNDDWIDENGVKGGEFFYGDL